MKVDKEKYGLVLAGGGGKGGYEIGVWKALKESKTLSVGAVSGTSVGALNAALYAAGDYETAENLWLNITRDKILTPDVFSAENIIKTLFMTLGSAASLLNYPGTTKAVLRTATKGFGQAGASVLVRKYITNRGGMFSREGLIELIKHSGILGKIDADTIPCYATCYNLTHKRIQSFCLNIEGRERITDILLASSAIPVAFPKEEIDGNEYYDGGIPFVGDNVPVKPLYELGYRRFIVVHLSRDGVDSFSQKFKDARFIHVFPKKDQGSFFNGTLDFDPNNAKKRIKQGYNDMRHQIEMLNNIDKSLIERNEMTEEIHIYSGKYYGSLDAILNNAMNLTEESKSLEDPDFKFDDLDKELTNLSSRLKQNSRDMDKFVLEGVTHISAMDAQMNELHRSKGFKKLWNDVSGKSKRLKQGIDSNLINAQQATTKMISKLVETDAMSVELIRTVQSQLQGATIKMGHVLKQHGYEITSIKDNYVKIAQLYGKLVLQDQEIAGAINNLYNMFFSNIKTVDSKFFNVEKEIEGLKDVQRLQNWMINIKFQTFQRKDYKELDIYEKIVCIASDFFFITKGVWDDEIILFVKGALDSLEISPYKIVSYNELIYKLMWNKNLRDYLFDRNGIRIFATNSESDIVPHYEAIVNGICIGERAMSENDINIESWIDKYMTDKTGGTNLYGNTAFDIICELFIIMLQFKNKNQSNDILPAYRDIRKAALLGDIDSECKYVSLLLEHNYITEAFDLVLDMESRIEENAEFELIRSKVIAAYAMYS